MDDISYLGASGAALSYNLFSYCENNPVNNVDPNGNVVTPVNVIHYFVLSLKIKLDTYFIQEKKNMNNRKDLGY